MSDASAGRLLIVDDEPLFLDTTAALLRKAGFHCTTAADGAGALEALSRESFDLVLSDLNMTGNLRLELLREGRAKWPETPLIVVTGAPSLPSAIESVRLGITDYLLKPVKFDDLLSAVRRAVRDRRRDVPASAPVVEAASGRRRFPEIIGESPAMLELFEVMERVADIDSSVLITGESGVGKEVVARAIHGQSRRRDGRLQVVDCTAIPETLFESVLFGHAKGSFTGAVKDQAGLLGEADGGAVFFDEIGELPRSLQAKLLRVIQEQTFTPVGKTTPIKVDTRFLCATNRDLESEVNAGRFRRDLFYRLAVIHIELPPLRQRGEDVILLARSFLKQLRAQGHGVAADFSAECLDVLRAHDWPGNIRELRNAVERGLAMARGDQILPGDLPPAVQRTSPQAPASAPRSARPTRDAVVQDAERDYLVSLLRKNAGNVAESARQAGLSRQGFHKLLQKYDVSAADYRPTRGSAKPS